MGTTKTKSFRAARPDKVHSAPISETFLVTLPATGFVRVAGVAAVAGIAKSTVWAWSRNGQFPKPTKLGARVTVWPVSDVRAWLADPAAWQAAHCNSVEG